MREIPHLPYRSSLYHYAVRLAISACVIMWCSIVSAILYARQRHYQNIRANLGQVQQPARFPAATKKRSSSKTLHSSLRVPIPSRADALVADSLRREQYALEVFPEIWVERGVVRLMLRESGTVEIAAFNILGRRVKDIYSGDAKAGANIIEFDITDLSDGVYICVARGTHFKIAQKFILSRQ
ncbi:MAG: T9SS type A sorting domain-containing protein [Candidatus Kapabacteria bacterium]|nr:T9SS type A sorting domain-containing protein [Candidatus Kapabacteria bacterium]